MKFTVDTKDFRAAIQIAARVIPAKSAWPILTNIKLVTNDDRVTLIGSDADTTFEADVAAQVETEGVACLPFDALSKFSAAAKSETLTVSEDGEKVKVSAGRNRITLLAFPHDDYPNFRPCEGDPIAIDKAAFCQALRFCVAAASDEEIKYHIAGPNWSEGSDSVSVWGTDGISAHHAMLRGLSGIGGGGTLPVAAAQTVLAIAEKHEEISFIIGEQGWHLATKRTRCWGKVIDAPFPNMESVVAQFPDWREVAILPKPDFSDALAVATCGAEADSTKSRNIVIRSAKSGPVVFRGHKSIGGVMHAGRTEIDAMGRSDFAGALSAKYLQGALSGVGDDDIVLEASTNDDGREAIRIRPSQKSNVLEMSAVILAVRASEAELADV